MPWTPASLRADLRSLGLTSLDTVLTHSSFRSLGPAQDPEQGTPEDVVKVLIGGARNAIFPTHTWAGAGPETPPEFDVVLTPSAQIGIIPEVARLHPGGLRSLHPTHSVVAFGPDAEWLTSSHFEGGICGIGSPYDRLCAPPTGTGYILLLGVDHERNTSLHMVEELLDIPEAIDRAAICGVTGYDGVRRQRLSHFHTWKHRRFMVLDHDLDALGIQAKGSVGDAQCRLVRAGDLRTYALEKLTSDPDYFWAT